jgi:hypothetical protein
VACPTIRRSITEEAGNDLIGLLDHSDGHARTRGDGNPPCHFSVRPQDAEGEVHDVRGAAFPLAVAGGLPEEFRHHPLTVGSLGEHVAMTAMRAGEVIVVPQLGDHAGRNGFLADIKMNEPGVFFSRNNCSARCSKVRIRTMFHTA